MTVALLLLALILAVIAFLIWWLLIETEGVYLGRGPVIWLYDLYATRYDGIKHYDDNDEQQFLALPLLTTQYPYTNPLVLDIATGTGRLPLALCHHPHFEGHVIALDLSHKMLVEAARKLHKESFQRYVTLLQYTAETLPFPDDSFDIVTCLEALEFMPDPDSALQEAIRVLRPGGVLLITQRINTIWMPGRLRSQKQLTRLLEQNQIEHVEIHPWQMDYSKVWGQKCGSSEFIGAGMQPISLMCPVCDEMLPSLIPGQLLRCTACQTTIPLDEHGIYRLHGLDSE